MATWTEKNLFEAGEQITPLRATITVYERAKNPASNVNAMCRHCGLKEETVDHITAECKKLSFTHIKQRHDQIALRIHHAILKSLGKETEKMWWKHKPDRITICNKDVVKWDPYEKTVRKVAHNKPDLIWEKEKETVIIEIGSPLDKNVISTEDEKTTKYANLMSELRKKRSGIAVRIVPIVIGATGLVSQRAEEYLASLNLDLHLGALQKIAAMQTIRILNLHK